MNIAITGMADRIITYPVYNEPTSVCSLAIAGHSVAGVFRMLITRVCRLATSSLLSDLGKVGTEDTWNRESATDNREYGVQEVSLQEVGRAGLKHPCKWSHHRLSRVFAQRCVALELLKACPELNTVFI